MKRLFLSTLVVGVALLVTSAIANAQASPKTFPELTVTNTPSAKVVSQNQKFTWTVRITNRGGVAAKNVKLVNKLPESVRLNNIISSQGPPCKVSFPKVVCTPGTIAPNGGETVTFYVQGTQANTVLKDKVKVTSPSEPQAANNTAVSKVRVR